MNEKGRLEDVRVRDMLDTGAMGYTFDDFEFGARQKPDPTIDETYAVRLPVDGTSLSGDRVPRVLTFERADVPIHPYCCRVFVENEGSAASALYVGTFTVLPVQRGGAKGLDKGVTMQLALPDAAIQRLSSLERPRVVLAGVPLNGRAIPDVAVFPRNARLSDRVL